MNLFTWLKNKAGKMPLSIAQAAGLTAVVGAAGFAAMSYLSNPTDNTTAFVPSPSNEAEVVYVAQTSGGGRYESNGEVGSTFNAAPSRSIRLANQQAQRESQERALEENPVQPIYEPTQPAGAAPATPKAYEMGGTDLGLGMGGSADKQLNASLESFSSLPNRLTGLADVVNGAQAQAQTPAGAAGAPAAGDQAAAAAGVPTLAKAQRNWGQGASGASGGSAGSGSNAFVVQDSGKNKKMPKTASDAIAQAGDVMADARAAMNQMQEGERFRPHANFGNGDKGLGATDKDATVRGAQRFANSRAELEFIRKKTAAVNASKTPSANEGGTPFFASTKISGGLTVDGSNITTGKSSSSGDLRGTSDRQMQGIAAHLAGVGEKLDERTVSHKDLIKWMWIAFPLSMIMIPLIGAMMSVSKALSTNPWTAGAAMALKIAAYACALATIAVLGKLFAVALEHSQVWGNDGYTGFAMGLAGFMTVATGLALWVPAVSKVLSKIKIWVWALGGVIGLAGAGAFNMLMNQADYSSEVDEANKAGEEDKSAIEGDGGSGE